MKLFREVEAVRVLTRAGHPRLAVLALAIIRLTSVGGVGAIAYGVAHALPLLS